MAEGGECDGSVLWPSRDLYGNESTKLKNKKAELHTLSKIHQIEVEESTSFKEKKSIFVKDREVGGKSTNALQFSSNKHPQEQNISVCHCV